MSDFSCRGIACHVAFAVGAGSGIVVSRMVVETLLREVAEVGETASNPRIEVVNLAFQCWPAAVVACADELGCEEGYLLLECGGAASSSYVEWLSGGAI